MADFNIDTYRDPDECLASWNLRKRFILKNHGRFQENRLICLAQCFVNVELYGNKYPVPVMIQLQELSKEMPEIEQERKQRKKSKCKTMTFVKASSSSSESTPANSQMPVVSPPKNSVETPMGFVKSESDFHSTDIKSSGYQELNQFARPPSVNKRAHFDMDEAPSKKKASKTEVSTQPSLSQQVQALLNAPSRKKSKKKKKSDVKYEDLMDADQTFAVLRHQLHDMGIIEGENPVSLLHMALQKVKMTSSCDFKELNGKGLKMFECVVSVDCIRIARDTSTSKKSAKKLAHEKALKMLQMPYHMIQENGGTNELLASEKPFNQKEEAEEEVEEDYGMLDNGELMFESNALNLGFTDVNRKKRMPSGHVSKDLDDLIFVIHSSDSSPSGLLRQSADFSKMLLEFMFNKCPEGVSCRISLEGQPLVECSAATKAEAKALASDNAVDLLKKMCWTIKIKQQADTDSASFSKEEIIGDVEKSMCVIPDSNVGNKLLRKMGWVGGGMGKDGSGIAEPVTMQQVVNRAGLGLDAEKGISGDFKEKIRKVVENYASSDNQDDLVFAPDLLKEERAIIHQHCKRLGLKSHSHGKDDARYLVVSRKRSPAQLFHHIMSQGGSTSKYELIPPQR